jgi:hypothetical protein
MPTVAQLLIGSPLTDMLKVITQTQKNPFKKKFKSRKPQRCLGREYTAGRNEVVVAEEYRHLLREVRAQQGLQCYIWMYT